MLDRLAVRKHGVISRMVSGFWLRVSPPLIISLDELQRIANTFRLSIHDAAAA